MTKIPDGPEYDRTRQLRQHFDKVGAEWKEEMDRKRSAQRQRRQKRLTALGSAGLVVLFAGGATAIGTKVFSGDAGPVTVDPKGVRELRRAPGDRRLADARVRDPREAAPWGLRRYVSTSGDTCVVAGRVVGGRLGLLQGGRFSELPGSAPGFCGDLRPGGLHLVLTWRTYGTMTGARTLVYGVADRTITSLALGGAGRRSAGVPIAADGSFIVALEGVHAVRGKHLRIASARGTTVKPLMPGG